MIETQFRRQDFRHHASSMDAIIDDEDMARTIVHGPGYLVHKYSGQVDSGEYLVVHLLDETILSRNDESEKKLNLSNTLGRNSDTCFQFRNHACARRSEGISFFKALKAYCTGLSRRSTEHLIRTQDCAGNLLRRDNLNHGTSGSSCVGGICR